MAREAAAEAAEDTTLDPAFVISLIRRLLTSDAAAEDAEEAASTLWDLSASPEHVRFLLQHQLPRACAAALLREPSPPSRQQELLLGCVANLLCAPGAPTALVADADVVMSVVGAGLCGAEDAAALAEACRATRAAVRDSSWLAALDAQEGVRERVLAALASTLDAALVQQAADLVSTLALAGGGQRQILRDAGALRAALAAMAAAPRCDGDAHAAADAAARCVEALVASDGAAALPALAAPIADGTLAAAMLPPLADAEGAPALSASVCIALSCVVAALQEAAAEDVGDSSRLACDSIEVLLRALAAHTGALTALRSLAADGGWGADAAAQQAAQELLAVLQAASCDGPPL